MIWRIRTGPICNTRTGLQPLLNRVIQHQPATLATFGDIAPGKWYEKDVAAMKELGIMGGFADGTFRPDATMTKAKWLQL